MSFPTNKLEAQRTREEPCGHALGYEQNAESLTTNLPHLACWYRTPPLVASMFVARVSGEYIHDMHMHICTCHMHMHMHMSMHATSI